jgi:hypothetical protein
MVPKRFLTHVLVVAALALLVIPGTILFGGTAGMDLHRSGSIGNSVSLHAQPPAVSTNGVSPYLRTALPSPQGAVAVVPILVDNTQASATGSFDLPLYVNSSRYAQFIDSNWSNVRFTYLNGTSIPSWIESNASRTAINTTVWVRLYSIAPKTNLTIEMAIDPSTTFDLSAAGPTGEAPQLSNPYAAWDDGSLVFLSYFNGNTPLSLFNSPSGISVAQRTSVPYGLSNIDAISVTGYGSVTYFGMTYTVPFPNQPVVIESNFQHVSTEGTTDEGAAGLVNAPTMVNVTDAEATDMGDSGAYFTNDYLQSSTQTRSLNKSGTDNGNWNFATLTYLGPNATSFTGTIAPKLYSSGGGFSGTVGDPGSPVNPLRSVATLYLGIIGWTDVVYQWDENINYMRARAVPSSGSLPSASFGTPLIAPTRPGVSPLAIDVPQGANVSTTINTTGSSNDTYEWLRSVNGGGFLKAFECTSPNGTVGPGRTDVECTLPGNRFTNGSAVTFEVRVNDSAQAYAISPPSANLTVSSAPVASVPVPNRASADVGQRVNFTTTASGGPGGPFTYEWTSSASGFGCGTSNSNTLDCQPTLPGNYTVAIQVVDDNGMVSSPADSHTFRVYPLPSGVLVASSASIVLGSPVWINLTNLGQGSGADSTRWNASGTGLGCGTSTGISLECHTTSVGNYTVTVKITDSNGGTGTVVSPNILVTSAAVPELVSASISPAWANLTVSNSTTFTVLLSCTIGSCAADGVMVTWGVNNTLVTLSPHGFSVTLSAGDNPGKVLLTVKATLGQQTLSSFAHIGLFPSGASSPPSKGPTESSFASVWIVLVLPVIVGIAVAITLYFRRHKPGIPASSKGGLDHSGTVDLQSIAPTSLRPENANAPNTGLLWPASEPLCAIEASQEDVVWEFVRHNAPAPDRVLAFTFGFPEEVAQRSGLPRSVFHRISRVEGKDSLTPGDLEKIGYLVERHLAGREGCLVVLPCLENLVEVNQTRNVRRLLDVLRDFASGTKGSILFSLDPVSLPATSVTLLERGAKRVNI